MTTTPAQFLDAYLAAVDAADAPTVKALYAPDARVFDAMGRWQFAGEAWPEHVDFWLSMVRPGGTSSVTDVEVVDGGDLAVVHATITYVSELSDGGTGTCTLRFTQVLRATGDGWRIVHEHSSFPVTMEEEPKVIRYERVAS